LDLPDVFLSAQRLTVYVMDSNRAASIASTRRGSGGTVFPLSSGAFVQSLFNVRESISTNLAIDSNLGNLSAPRPFSDGFGLNLEMPCDLSCSEKFRHRGFSN